VPDPETLAVGARCPPGDAAGAVLPTAGIGASMAMESDAVLGRADAGSVGLALRLFERRRRRRVDRVQADSRRLGWLALTLTRAVAWVRDQLVRFLDEGRLLGSLGRLLEEPC
jgi:2-polyprenyl-6-methoxyphenol hydroxylase-like FAD-dependent oxidoreductase